MADLPYDGGDRTVVVECKEGAVGFAVAAGTRGCELGETRAVDLEALEALLRVDAGEEKARVLDCHDDGGDVEEGGGEGHDSDGAERGRVLPFGAEGQAGVRGVATVEFVPLEGGHVVEDERAEGFGPVEGGEGGGDAVEEEFDGMHGVGSRNGEGMGAGRGFYTRNVGRGRAGGAGTAVGAARADQGLLPEGERRSGTTVRNRRALGLGVAQQTGRD